jgi:hypothetical protein
MGESRLRAADLLGTELPTDELSRQEDARAFLLDALASGPVAAKELLTAAREAGISERTLRRVKSQEQIEAKRTGYGNRGEWVWSTHT